LPFALFKKQAWATGSHESQRIEKGLKMILTTKDSMVLKFLSG